jgi:hypothetical protein
VDGSVDNSEGKRQEKRERHRADIRNLNGLMCREKKEQKKEGKNVDDDRHVYEKSYEDGTSTSMREGKHESQIYSQIQFPPTLVIFFFLGVILSPSRFHYCQISF